MRINDSVKLTVEATSKMAALKSTAPLEQSSPSKNPVDKTKEAPPVQKQPSLTAPEKLKNLINLIKNSAFVQRFTALKLSIFHSEPKPTKVSSRSTTAIDDPSQDTRTRSTLSLSKEALESHEVEDSELSPVTVSHESPTDFYILPPSMSKSPPSMVRDSSGYLGPSHLPPMESLTPPDSLTLSPKVRNEHETLTAKAVTHGHDKVESSREVVTDGMAKVHESAFVSWGEDNKTVFFTSQDTQSLNKVDFSSGKAHTTVLKHFEDLEKNITQLNTQLKDKVITSNPDKKSELEAQLTNLKQLKKEFTVNYKAVRDARVALEQLVAAHAPQDSLDVAKKKLESAQTKLSSQLELLSSDIGFDAATSKKKGSSEYNRMIFVMSPTGEFYALDQTRRDIALPDGHSIIADAKIHHSSMLDGGSVGGAGELRIGSQLTDLAHEITTDQTQAIRLTKTRSEEQLLLDKANQQMTLDFEKAMKTIQENAQSKVNRQFIEGFKVTMLEQINSELGLLKLAPHDDESANKRKTALETQKTELLNETFLLPQEPASELRAGYLSHHDEHFADFQKATLPQVLHAVIESQFPKGQVEMLSDQSGHYRPEMSMTGQTISQLEKNGVEVEKLSVTLGDKASSMDWDTETTMTDKFKEFGVGKGKVKQLFSEKLTVPATAVQEFAKAGLSEDDLRKVHLQKQLLGQQILQKSKKQDEHESAPLESEEHVYTTTVTKPTHTPTFKVDENGYMSTTTQDHES